MSDRGGDAAAIGMEVVVEWGGGRVRCLRLLDRVRVWIWGWIVGNEIEGIWDLGWESARRRDFLRVEREDEEREKDAISESSEV